jgi:hypothetical protein
MTLRRLLVLPLLTPLLVVVLVAALNPSPRLSFRVLTWVTPRAPLGLWLGGAALGGAALSGAATALALRQAQRTSPTTRRRVSTRSWSQAGGPEAGGWESVGTEFGPPRREEGFPKRSWGGGAAPGRERGGAAAWRESAAAVAPTRSPAEPPPTVDVAFRVLRRPTASAARPEREREPVPVRVSNPGEDDWGPGVAADEW